MPILCLSHGCLEVCLLRIGLLAWVNWAEYSGVLCFRLHPVLASSPFMPSHSRGFQNIEANSQEHAWWLTVNQILLMTRSDYCNVLYMPLSLKDCSEVAASAFRGSPLPFAESTWWMFWKLLLSFRAQLRVFVVTLQVVYTTAWVSYTTKNAFSLVNILALWNLLVRHCARSSTNTLSWSFPVVPPQLWDSLPKEACQSWIWSSFRRQVKDLLT